MRFKVTTFDVALALSLLIHLAVMWQWLPRLRLPSPEAPARGEAMGTLTINLAPPPSPAPTPPSAATLPPQAAPALRSPPPRAVTRPRPAPPVIALSQPAPEIPSQPPAIPSDAEPTPARPHAEGDLASYIAARRRERGESAPLASAGNPANAPPAEDDHTRANRVAAANLASQRPMSFGYDPAQGGGVFQITRLGYDNAEFIFFGWNREIRRNTKQLIEVRKGGNNDIRIAVVRRMIAIIREYEQRDFLWESRRLGRNLMLSARATDNTGLEEFMMREFFDYSRRAP